ncbi:MAG TPA: TonB-dependent receptor [Rhodocyclaceae bacterium]
MKRIAVIPLCIGLAAPVCAEGTTLGEVTVTSSADDISERKQAATQKVIVTRQDIENMGALTVSDVMGKLPGVDAGTPGADGSMAMRSRGMARDSVQILIDGERIAGSARMAQAMVGRLPSTELDRVEIVRGASAEFGGNAPVSVNLVFKKARSKDSTALKVAAGFRNNEPNTQFSFSKGGGDKEFMWMVPVTVNHHEMPAGKDVARTDSTGIDQADSERGATRINEMVLSPRFTWKSGTDSFTVSPSLFRAFGKRGNDASRIDYATPANGYDRRDNERNRTEFNRIRAEGEMVRGGVKYSGRFAGSNGGRDADVTRTSLSNAGITTVSTDSTRRRESDANGMFRLDWAAGSHALAAALEGMRHHRNDTETNTGSIVGDETHSGWDRQWSLWVQDEWAAARGVTLTGGLRGEFIDYAMDGTGRSYDKLLPSIAVRWEPADQWVLRSSLGAGIKPPRLEELSNLPVYSIAVNTPTEPDRRGNPSLRAERSVNLEAVVERYLPNEMGVFGANAYLRKTQDFTERRVTLEGARWVERPWNEGDATHWGLEVDGKLRTDNLGWKGATLRAHLTLPRSRVHDERLGIAREARETPRYLLSAGIDQTLPAGMSLGASMQHSGPVRTEVPGEQSYVTQRRTVVDAYVLRRLSMNLNLRLSLQNVFKADTRREADYTSGSAWWSLDAREKGMRAVLLSLEGKW